MAENHVLVGFIILPASRPVKWSTAFGWEEFSLMIQIFVNVRSNTFLYCHLNMGIAFRFKLWLQSKKSNSLFLTFYFYNRIINWYRFCRVYMIFPDIPSFPNITRYSLIFPIPGFPVIPFTDGLSVKFSNFMKPP